MFSWLITRTCLMEGRKSGIDNIIAGAHQRGDGPLLHAEVGMSTVEEEEGGGYHFVTDCYVD